jgi:hypothetical protein
MQKYEEGIMSFQIILMGKGIAIRNANTTTTRKQR